MFLRLIFSQFFIALGSIENTFHFLLITLGKEFLIFYIFNIYRRQGECISEAAKNVWV